jgi:nucleoside-diphosphate-sugar epimerase
MGHGPIAMVDARDVADCAIAALLNPEAPDQAWHLTGPRPVTFDDLAASLGVPYLNVPARVAAAALRRQGASAFDIEHAVRMAAYFATGADGAPTPAVMQLTGRPARTLDAFLSEHATAFAGPRFGPLTRLLALRPQLKGI